METQLVRRAVALKRDALFTLSVSLVREAPPIFTPTCLMKGVES